MLTKRTSKNQVTIPKEIMDRFPDVEYFEVSAAGDQIVLCPVRVAHAAQVREKLSDLGITEDDVTDAIIWARKQAE